MRNMCILHNDVCFERKITHTSFFHYHIFYIIPYASVFCVNPFVFSHLLIPSFPHNVYLHILYIILAAPSESHNVNIKLHVCFPSHFFLIFGNTKHCSYINDTHMNNILSNSIMHSLCL